MSDFDTKKFINDLRLPSPFLGERNECSDKLYDELLQAIQDTEQHIHETLYRGTNKEISINSLNINSLQVYMYLTGKNSNYIIN